jgi:hypothetical protein
VLKFQSLRRRRTGRALLVGAVALASTVALVAPADAVAPIGPTPATQHSVTLTATPVVGLTNGQAVTFTVHTAGGTTLVGNITAHICIHGSTTYGPSNFGYSDSSASRCVYQPGIVSGGLTGADYEKVYPPYAGSETTSGPLTFKAGTGTVTWGNALGFGPFTLTASATSEADLVIQVNLSGDDTPTTYFIQPLTFASATPGAPTAPAASPGSASAVVSWVAPANHGATAITGYVVTPFLAGVAQPARTFNTAATTETITGLTNAKAYTFKVAAKNSAGTGPQSVASAAITVGAPKAPTGVVAKSGSTTTATGPITVTYVAPANNGAAITKFTATCVSSNGGATKTGVHTGATAVAIPVAATTTAKTYTCKVTATNARGTSPASAPSAAIIVGAPAQMAKPTVTKTAAGTLKATFTLLTAAQANGSALTAPKYTVACTSGNGGVAKTVTGAASPISVTGLTATKTYTCTVRGHNARGLGPVSPPSTAVAA